MKEIFKSKRSRIKDIHEFSFYATRKFGTEGPGFSERVTNIFDRVVFEVTKNAVDGSIKTLEAMDRLKIRKR